MTNVVIGAASGMGVAVAHELAPRGRLLVADRNADAVESVAKEIGGDVEAFACDVTDQAQVDALLAAVDDLGALVHTAGISGTMAPGRQILEVNLIGVARMVRAAEAKLRPGAVAVFFASQSGYSVPENERLFRLLEDPLVDGFIDELAKWYDVDNPALSYQVSKRGVHRVVRANAARWGARGARIMSLSPGLTDTPMERAEEAAHPMMADIAASSPLGRRGTPEEIARVVSFVVSDQATLLTGSDVLADGGMATVIPSGWANQLHPPTD